jgi:hypothetical protein
MTLRTLGDVRWLIDLLPAEYRQRDTWQVVAMRLEEAARSGDVTEVAIALRMVLMLERLPCEPQ